MSVHTSMLNLHSSKLKLKIATPSPPVTASAVFGSTDGLQPVVGVGVGVGVTGGTGHTPGLAPHSAVVTVLLEQKPPRPSLGSLELVSTARVTRTPARGLPD